MTIPQHTNDQAWRDAEALIERVEDASRNPSTAFLDEAAMGLKLTTGASSVSLWRQDRGRIEMLFQSGFVISDDVRQKLDIADDHQARSRWADEANDRLIVSQRIDFDFFIGLELRFDKGVPLVRRRPTMELAEVLLDLVTTVYLRTQVSEFRRLYVEQSRRDALIQRMGEGIGLADSFYAIATAIASEVAVDRVSLLQRRSHRYRLVSTSTQPNVDRRARQVRLLEALVDNTVNASKDFAFSLGAQDNDSRDLPKTLESYLHESGCREISIQRIDDRERNEPMAVIVVERFRGRSDDGAPIERCLHSFEQAIESSVATALAREDAGWGLVLSRFSGPNAKRRNGTVAAIATFLMLALCLIPTTLKIPVDGRVMTTKRSHLFSPTEGIVDQVFVTNGQEVREGQTLIALRSQNLELQQSSIDGALATARTRLLSLQSMRSRRTSAEPGRDASSSASEQVLKKEIEGLELQSQSIKQQIALLEIKSPMDGRVERWDLEQSLVARPVAHGQYLVDVISDSEGWIVELDVPDSSINYLISRQRRELCNVEFRLRSDPTRVHQGRISQIAEVAQVNAAGQSVVRAIVQLEHSSSESFRSGADVLAHVHCGKRSIGFALFRGVIEWWRSQAWI